MNATIETGKALRVAAEADDVDDKVTAAHDGDENEDEDENEGEDED